MKKVTTMTRMEIANFRPVNTFIDADKIEGKKTIRVTKDPKVKAVDEATFARLVESDFRNGIIESVNGDFTSKYNNIEKGVWGSLISEGAIRLVTQAITIYKELEVSPPIYVLISLMGVKDHCMILDPSRFHWAGNRFFEQQELKCPEVVIYDYDIDLKNEFKFIFDMIWNAVGFDRAYD